MRIAPCRNLKNPAVSAAFLCITLRPLRKLAAVRGAEQEERGTGQRGLRGAAQEGGIMPAAA